MELKIPEPKLFENLALAAGTSTEGNNINKIFSALLKHMIISDWQGACHESSACAFVLLSEVGVKSIWAMGEASVNDAFFDHSWIEITTKINDIAICNPMQSKFRNGPVIRGLDIETGQQTTTLYAVSSGLAFDPLTEFVRKRSLTDYLIQSPMHPAIGSWALILKIAKESLGINLDLDVLLKKYDRICYTTKPELIT